MADFSSYTHKWRATTTNDHRSDANKITKRNRQPVSCIPCRTRKLKCDRGHPCDACAKRNDEESCIYGKMPAATPTPNGSTRRDDPRISNMKAQDRLKHLEELVRGMVERPAHQDPSLPEPSLSTTEVDDSEVLEGSLDRVADGGTYVGSTHWSAVLQHINELKNDLGSASVEYDDVHDAVDFSKPDALFGGQRPSSLQHILNNHLPDRLQMDRRISQYFNAKYTILPMIHMRVFQRQYEEFWKDPVNANPIWVSTLFSICCLAASLSMVSNKSPTQNQDAMNVRTSFETAAGQCLLLGNYSKPQPYVVEALALFLQCKYAGSLDPSREVALMFAVQTKLAFLMGYHRDGSNFPAQFTPFEAEMRRRTWAMVKQFDLMVSFQLGIPNNVPPESFDTANPSNLLDADFDEDCKELPPSRPETEMTQIMYFVVKSRIVDVYAKIYHHAISFRSVAPSTSEIMALDRQVRQQADSIPEALRIKPVSQSVTIEAHEIMVRLNLSLLWRKCLCVLHRKYMTVSGNEYSHNTCVETASAMCASIIDIYPEFQPGGNFENDGWMLSSFTIVDFLLAAIVLCLAMSVSRKKYVNHGGNPQKWLTLEQTKDVLDILDKSKNICVEISHRSQEAKRVSGVLEAFLDRLRTTKQGPAAGADGARYFLNMSNGTLATHGSKRSPNVDRNPLSMTPLSLKEQEGLTSVTSSTGMVPPWWHLPDKTTEAVTPMSSVGQIELSPNKSTPSSSQTQPPSTDGSHNAYEISQNGLPINAMAPAVWNMDLDVNAFSGLVDGLDTPGAIDWTRLDQFTGFFGTDSGLFLSDTFSHMPDASFNMNENSFLDYENWESTPMYNLGGRAREPVSGRSQQP